MSEKDSENLGHILSEICWANILKAYELRLLASAGPAIERRELRDEIEKVCVEYINGVYFPPEGEE